MAKRARMPLRDDEIAIAQRFAEQGVRLSALETRILAALQSGKLTGWDRLVHAVYGDDIDGGPDNPMNCIKVMVTRLRQKGFRVVCTWGVGLTWETSPDGT